MAGFRLVALLLPAAAAFLAPALAAWRPGWKAPAAGHGALMGVALIWGLAAGASFPILLATIAMATAFAFFAFGLHLAAGQLVSGLVVVALGSSLFLAPSVVEDAIQGGGSAAAQGRLDLLLSVNPWAVLASRVFDIDLLRDFSALYRSSSHLADYVDARPPAWGGVAAGYAGGGLFLAGVAAAAARLRRRNAP